MKIFKKLSILICICILFCIPVLAQGKNTDTATFKNGNADVECTEMESGINVRVTNNSKETLKNINISVKSDKGYISTKQLNTLKNIESEKSDLVQIDLIKDNKVVSLVGYQGFKILKTVGFISVIVICLVIAFCIFSKMHGNNQGIKPIIKVICFCIIVFAVCLGMLSTSREKENYSPFETGENFIRDVDFKSEKFGNLKVSVEYNQDIVEVKTTEKDVTIESPKEYEYDEDTPVTSDEEVIEEGAEGKKHVIITTTYRNGKKDDEDITEKVISEPTPTKVSKGIKTVKKVEDVEPTKVYISNEKMYVGDYKLKTSEEESKKHYGKVEKVYTWNSKNNKLVCTENTIKKAGVDEYYAGCLVKRSDVEKAHTTYNALEDKEVGYTNVKKKTVDGEKNIIYRVDIDNTTGKPVENCVYEFVSSSEVKPVDGVTEVGVKKVEKVTTKCEENIEYDSTKWDNYSDVKEKGQDKIEEVTSIMVLNEKTGEVTDTVKKEVSRKILQEAKPASVIKGSKEPEFVEEKVLTDHVKYNTVYKANSKLKGDEQKVVQKGEMGRLYTTQLVAVDEKGNKIVGYEPKIVEKDALVDPVDEIIEVAEDSDLLKEK